MSETHFQVLIVGGGIVGLSASLFLSSHNISHLVVERHQGTSIHPRARGVNTRIMEIFKSIGVDDAVREAGAELAPSMGIVRGTSFKEVMEPRKRKEGKGGAIPFASWYEGIVSPVNGTRCTQDKLEPALLNIARERGGDLRFHTECVSFEQNENGVTATLRDRETGMTSIVHAEYLIAADGAGSPIRKKLGVPMTGKGVIGNLLNILFEADLKNLVRGREISLCTIERPELRGLLTAINNSDVWVFHLSYHPEKGKKAADYTPERCKDLLCMAIGIPDLNIEVKSILPWQPSDSVAGKLQHGRIFLAGDAAHQMTPYAGQGATTGIADVFDLSYKLALVLKGQATAKLLETYEEERLPVGQLVARKSGELADHYGLPTTGSWRAIPSMLRNLPLFTGFGYDYTSRAIVPEEVMPARWIPWWFVPWSIPSLIFGINGKPGTRAPHVWVQHGGRQISTLDILGKGFVLLTGSEGKLWCQAAVEISSKLGVDLVAYRAGPTGDLSDSERRWETAAGISSSGALLIRPDAFVAWRVQDQDGNLRGRLGAVLEKILCR